MEKSRIIFWFFLYILSVQCISIRSAQLVPALYVFGDSTVDAGNNNNLQTKAKANYLPYGIDFNNKPTGRFTNGMTTADFMATFLGLPLPPAYMNIPEMERSKVTTGMNYGSASCGILPSTGSVAGTCLSLDQQIELFKNTIKNTAAKVNLAKSIIYVSIGANDYTLNYMNTTSENSKTFKPDGYAKFVTDELIKRLKTLYELGARKFLVNGLGPIGCLPVIKFAVPFNTKCVEVVNSYAMLFNDQLSTKLRTLQSQLPNSFFSYSDHYKTYQSVLDAPPAYGIKDVTLGCWDRAKSVCPVRDEYLFFDDAHITQNGNKIITTLCFNHTTACAPLNLLQLASA